MYNNDLVPKVVSTFTTSDNTTKYSYVMLRLFSGLSKSVKSDIARMLNAKINFYNINSGEHLIYNVCDFMESDGVITGLQFAHEISNSLQIAIMFLSMGSYGNSSVSLGYQLSSNTWTRTVTSDNIIPANVRFQLIV